MTEIYSLPASTSLVDEFNALAPGRRKTQDGTIGDRAHMERVSDHNLDEIGNTGTHHDTDDIPEVHARDVDSRGPWPAGWSMERVVQFILARCRAGIEKRLLYIIFNGRIWEASNDWRQRTYTGADQHELHAHFSFRYGSGSTTANPENITTPWGFLAAYEEDEMPSVDEIWNQDGIIANPSERSDAKDNPTVRAAFALGDTWARTIDLQTAVAAQGKALGAAITALGAKDQVDEKALAAALAPAVAALIIPALPAGADVTGEQLQAAIVGALRELAAE